MRCGDKITVDGAEMAVRGYILRRIEAVRVPDRISKPGWHEYPVEARNGVWMVMNYKGGCMALHKAMSRVGFGGVRWRKPDGSRTTTGCMWSRAFVDGRPWKPIAVRFWEGGDA
jgi:hypothetical protein